MSEAYRERPSALLAVQDEYTAFCLDEACAYILGRMRNKEKPQFLKAKVSARHYTRASELYSQIK